MPQCYVMRILYVLLLTTTSKGTLMVKISVHQSCSYVISLTECNSGTIQKIAHLELTLRLSSKYSVIQKDGLNFVSIYFKIRTSDKQIWYGLNSKQHLNTRQPVGCGIPSSLLALRFDLRGLRSKLSWIRLTFSSDTRGRPEFCLYTDSLFAQIGDSNDKCSSSLEIECWNED